MANYTITRHTESSHVYGCTDFSTIQQAGQISSVIPGSALDATVEWDLQANTGYSVSIEDFEFTAGTLNIVDPAIHEYINMPSPIYKVSMEQLTTTLIRVTITLGDSNGSNFIMPDNDIDTIVDIKGCANIAGEGVRLRLSTPIDPNTSTQSIVSKDLVANLSTNAFSDTTDEVYGTLPSVPVSKANEDTYVMSYNVQAASGYRYTYAPDLSFTDEGYYAKRTIITTDNPHETGRKDITAVSFDIYKR